MVTLSYSTNIKVTSYSTAKFQVAFGYTNASPYVGPSLEKKTKFHELVEHDISIRASGILRCLLISPQPSICNVWSDHYEPRFAAKWGRYVSFNAPIPILLRLNISYRSGERLSQWNPRGCSRPNVIKLKEETVHYLCLVAVRDLKLEYTLTIPFPNSKRKFCNIMLWIYFACLKKHIQGGNTTQRKFITW